jgi:Helix-turn-helix domain
MSTSEPILSEFLTKEELAVELKRHPQTLDRWRRLGEGPPITKFGRCVLYRRSSLQAWLRARERYEHDDNDRGEKSNAPNGRSVA